MQSHGEKRLCTVFSYLSYRQKRPCTVLGRGLMAKRDHVSVNQFLVLWSHGQNCYNKQFIFYCCPNSVACCMFFVEPFCYNIVVESAICFRVLHYDCGVFLERLVLTLQLIRTPH